MATKRFYLIIIIIALLAILLYLFNFRATKETSNSNQTSSTGAVAQFPAASFDTNDNLDKALQDLDDIK